MIKINLIIMNEEILYDKDSIIKRLKTKLKYHKIDSDEFLHILKENKAYLSGSYLLGSICNINFNENCLDIYVFNNIENKQLESQIHSCIYKNTKYPRKDDNNHFLDYNSNNYYPKGIKSRSWMFVSSSYYYFEYPKHLRHLIKTLYIDIKYINTQNYADIKSYIDTFNLHICSNYYNGEELYIKNLLFIKNK